MNDRVVFDAWGSAAVVALTDPERLPAAHAAVEEVIDAFDRACSRFREDSELSRLNAAGGDAVAASPLLIEAVGAALSAARQTDGDVVPTVGEALVALGYDRDFAAIGAPAATESAVRIVPVPGWQTVQINEDEGTIRLGRGVKLDLGATAKALAADHAAAAASEAAGCGVLVSLGGDLSIAGPAPLRGWQIRVTDDHRADITMPGQSITLTEGGLATSSTSVRRWPIASGEAHHLIDPATGLSASSCWRTVSVTASSCLEANVASTAAIIRGEAAIEWLVSIGLPSRLVGVDGRVRHLAGWPAEGDDLPAAGT